MAQRLVEKVRLNIGQRDQGFYLDSADDWADYIEEWKSVHWDENHPGEPTFYFTTCQVYEESDDEPTDTPPVEPSDTPPASTSASTGQTVSSDE